MKKRQIKRGVDFEGSKLLKSNSRNDVGRDATKESSGNICTVASETIPKKLRRLDKVILNTDTHENKIRKAANKEKSKIIGGHQKAPKSILADKNGVAGVDCADNSRKTGPVSSFKVMSNKRKQKKVKSAKNQESVQNSPKLNVKGSFVKPDWVAFKKQKKELRIARKQKKSSSTYNVGVEAKQLWEVLRNETNPSKTENVEQGIIKMHNLLKSNLKTFVMCHDMSRVVQWLIKKASPEVRSEIIEEVKPYVTKMIVDRYSSKCIGSLLKYGKSEAANVIIHCCMGHVVKFMSSLIAHPYLEKAYAEYATEEQKLAMHSEFYSDLYKTSKDSSVKCLADTYKESESLKNAFLTSTKEHIKRVLLKNKATNKSTLLYAIMAEFLKNCSKDDRDELLDIVQGWIFDLPSTKDAGFVGLQCVWYATNKEKKSIVKSLKGHIVELAKSKHLQMILFAVFSTVDDTVLLSRALIPEVEHNLKELGSHVVGRKLIVHLVSYGNLMFFHPIEKNIFEEGERMCTAKKDPLEKRKELRTIVSKPFLQSVAQEPEFWFSSTDSCLTALAILNGADNCEEKETAFISFAKLLVDPTATCKEEIFITRKQRGMKGTSKKIGAVGELIISGDENISKEPIDRENNQSITTEITKHGTVPLICHGAVHLAVKQLVKENSSFAKALMEELTDESCSYWITHNRGCFTIIHLLESGNVDKAKLQDLMKKYKTILSSASSTGAKILLKNLKTL